MSGSRPGGRPCLFQRDGRGLRWNEHVQALAWSRQAVEVAALPIPAAPLGALAGELAAGTW